VARGSTMMNIVQQAAGSVGTAVMSVILTNRVLDDAAAATYMAVQQREIPAQSVTAPLLEAGRVGLAGAFGHTFTVAAVLIVLCLVPAFLLPRRRIVTTEETAPPVLTH
jgi:hypothetical protein